MRRSILLLLFAILIYSPESTAAPTFAVDQAPAVDELRPDDKPDGFVLSAAFPNPFNPQTSFSLTTEQRQEVTVEVFNVLGISVKRLFKGTMDANETRTFTFEADDLPSGIYLYRVSGKSFTATRQMTLLK